TVVSHLPLLCPLLSLASHSLSTLPLTPLLALLHFFFFNDTATTEIYTLSLHDALPICIFIPKLRLILILNSFLGSSDSLVFSELFHSLAPRPLAARSISDFLLTYLAT